jgi:phosphohistidine phosphatase
VDIYVIRHAEAHPLGEGGISADEDRPLTEAGMARARQVGEGLQRRGVHLEMVLTSPLVRARQTAEQLLSRWPAPAPELRICEALAPGRKRRKLARALGDLGREQVAVVGHEPALGEWIAWLLGSKKVQISLEKAGVACVHCDNQPGRGAGTLLWLVPPEWLV